MTDFVSDLENELRAASTRRVRLATARIPRLPAAGIAMALSVAVCLIVVLAVLQAHGGTAATPVARSSPGAQLTTNFSIFRRQRTAADSVPAGLRFECSGPSNATQYLCFIDQRPEPVSKTAERLPALLQLGQSRRLTLAGGIGTAWMIPAHGMLCVLIRIPSQLFFKPFPGTMTCEAVSRVLVRPPMQIDTFLFAHGRHGYELAIEPDTISSATISYPGGSEPTILQQGFLLGCVGQGAYRLQQTTSDGTRLKSALIGGYGPSRSVTCPRLHLGATVSTQGPTQTTPRTTAKAPGATTGHSRNPVINDCLRHGKLTHSYTKTQLRHAFAQTPATVRKYTSCATVITQALR